MLMTPQKLASHFSGRGPLLHIVLDGWGIGPPTETNAMFHANLPITRRLAQDFPCTQLWTHGKYVGLPGDKDLGGSEVGHMTMGAGVVMEQGPSLIKRLMDSGEFFQGAVLQQMIAHATQHEAPLHLLGLLSDGNVHSHLNHTVALIEHAFAQGLRRCYVHALLDGRDVAIQSALEYTETLEALFHQLKSQRPEIDYAFASGGGREQITMDRDQNWSKIERGWNTHVHGQSDNQFGSIREAIEHFRSQTPDIVDQDLPDFVLVRDGQPIGPMKDNHCLIFTNFRADRAIEFTHAVLDDDFPHFDRGTRPQLRYAGMMTYDQDLLLPPDYLVGTPTVANPFGKRILELGKQQFRLTETQKFAHVTFFFNGGYREPLDAQKENYALIASDKVASFAQAPAMKAREITDKAIEFLRSGKYHYGLINYANADMVGHSGNLEAAINAVEVVDQQLGRLLPVLREVNGIALITADHGNADEMKVKRKDSDDWEPSTKHSLNPVPLIIYDPLYREQYQLRSPGPDQNWNLSHIAATNLILMGLEPPEDLNESLFRF
jgi:2,3-bisphosphoglycerate-independent phosphoglycerate mutase